LIVRQDQASLQQGYQDGFAGEPPQPIKMADELACASGFIEGSAARETTGVAARVERPRLRTPEILTSAKTCRAPAPTAAFGAGPRNWRKMKCWGRLTSVVEESFDFRSGPGTSGALQKPMAVIFVVASLSIVAQQSADTSVGMMRSAKPRAQRKRSSPVPKCVRLCVTFAHERVRFDDLGRVSFRLPTAGLSRPRRLKRYGI
jgi:hypothetical protein